MTNSINVVNEQVGVSVPAAVIPVATQRINGLDYQEMVQGIVNVPRDKTVIAYDASNNISTVVYSLLGVTQATITCTYVSGNLTQVERT